jgi:hypothetical protein
VTLSLQRKGRFTGEEGENARRHGCGQLRLLAQNFGAGTISVRFFSQDVFNRHQKIKFRFFLVDVDADF